ncbi:MAG: hypothetical protein HRT88_22815 [Lentisphaeraceae bacterium]|nr:hypothetical protein [Lentisphaeraceae bacterium]
MTQYITNSVIAFILCFCMATVKASDRIDLSNMLLKHLKIDHLDVDNIDVENEIKKNTDLKKDATLNTAVLYKIYGITYEDFAKKHPEQKQSRMKKYSGNIVPLKTLFFTKKYLMDNAINNPDQSLRHMAYTALGHIFVNDKEIIHWLFKQSLAPAINITHRSSALSALNCAAETAHTHIALLAFKSWLRSSDADEVEHALRVLVFRGKARAQLLPDLMARYIGERQKGVSFSQLDKVLKLYDKNDLLKYLDILEEVHQNDPTKKQLKSVIQWLKKKKKK